MNTEQSTTIHPMPKAVAVIGRRWFQRSYGNTYNTAEIYVDGKLVATLPREYGYGDYYLQRATDELERLGYMPGRVRYPNGGAEPGWQYFRDERGCSFDYRAFDVPRKRDLTT